VEQQGGRVAGISGILFIVLTYAGVILGDTGILGGLPEPPPGAGGEQWVAYYTSSMAALLSRNYLGSLAFCFFLVFVGGLCNAVWGAQDRLPMLGLVAFGGGVTAAALQLAWTGSAYRLRARENYPYFLGRYQALIDHRVQLREDSFDLFCTVNRNDDHG
jgi:hypothetical protein